MLAMSLETISPIKYSFFDSEEESIEDIRYDEISEQIRDLWVGSKNDHCVGAVFTWITRKCSDFDKENPEIKGLFQQFQKDYTTDRGDPVIDSNYLPLSTLEKYRMKETQTQYFSIEENIFKSAAKIGGKQMVLLYDKKKPHAFGLNTDTFRLFDIALRQDFHAENEEDLTLGIEALIAIYSNSLNVDFSHFQLISFQDY